MTAQDILDQINTLENLIPEMEATQKRLHTAMLKATLFVKYVKENHPGIFDRALEYSEKGE